MLKHIFQFYGFINENKHDIKINITARFQYITIGAITKLGDL